MHAHGEVATATDHDIEVSGVGRPGRTRSPEAELPAGTAPYTDGRARRIRPLGGNGCVGVGLVDPVRRTGPRAREIVGRVVTGWPALLIRSRSVAAGYDGTSPIRLWAARSGLKVVCGRCAPLWLVLAWWWSPADVVLAWSCEAEH